MNTENRQERIKLLRRQEDRNNRLPVLLTNLSEIAGRQVSETEVLTIDQIDKFQIELNGTDFDFNFLNLSFPKSKATELQNLLTTLTYELSQTNYLSLSHSSDIAVFKIKTDFVSRNLEELISLDNDTFSLHDQEFRNGLWVDLFHEYWYLEDKKQYIWIYELRIFGKDWIKRINANL